MTATGSVIATASMWELVLMEAGALAAATVAAVEGGQSGVAAAHKWNDRRRG